MAATFGSGWWAAGSFASARPVTIDRFFSGTVTDVSVDGSAVCVNPDLGGPKLCGRPYQQGGAARLSVGDHVGIAVEEVKTGRPGESKEIYVIYSPPPSQ